MTSLTLHSMALTDGNSPVMPYPESLLSKKEQVTEMFNQIAPRYDLMNRLLSLGIDRFWRKKAISLLKGSIPRYILDMATGTADFAILAQRIMNPRKTIGIDLSKQMLDLGKQKIRKAGLEDKIDLFLGDSETIIFPDQTFDAVIVAFGIRNFEHLEIGLSEMFRVLKKGGQIVILEFSKPSGFLIKQLFNFYFRYITPALGKWLAGNRKAYSYLPDSVRVFPQGKEMVRILTETGYHSASCKPLTFGICSVYSAFR